MLISEDSNNKCENNQRVFLLPKDSLTLMTGNFVYQVNASGKTDIIVSPLHGTMKKMDFFLKGRATIIEQIKQNEANV